MSKSIWRLICAVFFSLSFTGISQATPKIIASIKPLHSLVSALTNGVAEVELLLSADFSPHNFSLKPSMAQAIQNADLIFWIGPDMETALQAPIQNLAQNAKIIDFSDLQNGLSPHIWLDPQNAAKMLERIVEQLSALDPQNSPTYQKNATDFLLKLDQLEAEIDLKLAQITTQPFVVYHNAFDHFIARFNLAQIAFISQSEAHKPGARRLREIAQLIDQNHVQCIFTEPQFETKTIDILLEGRTIQTGTLDPIGVNIDAGPNQYFELVHQMADSLAACLQPR